MKKSIFLVSIAAGMIIGYSPVSAQSASNNPVCIAAHQTCSNGDAGGYNTYEECMLELAGSCGYSPDPGGNDLPIPLPIPGGYPPCGPTHMTCEAMPDG